MCERCDALSSASAEERTPVMEANNEYKFSQPSAGAAFMSAEEYAKATAEDYANAAVAAGIASFQRKERERQYQEEVTYAHKREIASSPKDPNGHTWTDKEFSHVYNHGESAASLAHLRLVALKSLKSQIDHAEKLIAGAISEMPEPKTDYQVRTAAQLAGALALLQKPRPDYINDVRIWSPSWLCSICNCAACRERMEHIAQYGNGYSPEQPEAPFCCKHEDSTLFLPF